MLFVNMGGSSLRFWEILRKSVHFLVPVSWCQFTLVRSASYHEDSINDKFDCSRLHTW